VFIDADPATWTMDIGLLVEALSDAAKSGHLPKAVVATDLYGQCCDYNQIEAACAAYEVPLIVDAAEALGAMYWGEGGEQSAAGRKRSAGDAGWAAVYSFNGNKIITTSGGGMLASRDGGVVERARKRSQQAREARVWYEHEELGYNYRISNILAAIGVGQLESLASIVEKKRRIFGWYQDRLNQEVGVSYMPEAAYGRCTRWLTVVEIRSMVPTLESVKVAAGPSATVDRVRLALEEENIESRPVWKPMHLQPVFSGTKIYGGRVGERLFVEGLCLPSGAGLEERDVSRVCESMMKALE